MPPPPHRRARLDPTGRVRLPQRTTLLRTALVTLLLLTAAGVLYQGAGGPPAPAAGPPGDPGATPAPPTLPRSGPGAPSGWPAGSSTDGTRLPIPAGLVGVPVGLASPSALAMVRPGDRVDLLLVPGDGEPDLVAGDVTVLAVAAPDATVLLALSPDQARRVVATTARFALIVRP